MFVCEDNCAHHPRPLRKPSDCQADEPFAPGPADQGDRSSRCQARAPSNHQSSCHAWLRRLRRDL